MSPTASSTPERDGRGRGARLLSLLVTVIALALGAWAVLHRRPPSLPRFVEEAGGAPGPTAGAVPEPTPRPQPQPQPEPSPEPTPEPSPEPTSEPTSTSPEPDPAVAGGAADLLEVQGIGRRSAQALADAGVDSLAKLAGTDDDTLVAALERAGLRRSPTLSSWATQARRLLQG